MLKKSLLLIAAAAFLFAGCGGAKNEEQGGQKPAIVIVAAAVTESVKSEDSFVGKVDAASKAAITARVSGYLSERLVKEGDFVKKNQPIFMIEKSNYAASVSQSKAALEQAKVNANNAKLQKERGEALLKSNGISRARYDDLLAAYEAANASVMQARAVLDMAELNLNYTTVTSPVSGRVGFINYNIGETVGPTSGPLTTVIAVEPMYVIFSIGDKQLQQIKHQYGIIDNNASSFSSKTDLTITMADSHLYGETGTVNFVDNAVSGATDSIKVRGSFANPDGILVQGQTVNINLVSKTPIDSVVVPQSALQTDLSGKYLTVANYTDTQNKVANIERRYVQTGSTLPGNKQVILTNLKDGEMVIVEGLQKIRPGAPVTALTKAEYDAFMQQMAQGQGGGK